jgi:predicted protein tyrosine phosphatase
MKLIKTLPHSVVNDNKEAIINRSDVAVICILEPDEQPIFDRTTHRILSVRFDHSLPGAMPGNSKQVAFSDAHATKILDFLLGLENFTCIDKMLVSCNDGSSLSGAVAKAARKHFGVDAEKFHLDNPFIRPNKHVLRKLHETRKSLVTA